MTIAARLMEILTSKPDSARLLYGAEYVVDRDEGAYRHLDISRFPGLLILHTISCGGNVRVLSYWCSVEHFHGCSAHLGDALGTTAPPCHGPVDHIATFGRPWWRRVSAYTAVVPLVAILSTAKTAEGHVDWFFEQPALSFESERMQRNVVSKDEFEAIVTITNPSAVSERVNVDVSQERLAEGKLSFDRVDFSIPNLAPGSSHSLRITGRAERPGPVAIVVAAKTKAGLMRQEKTSSERIPIEVWPLTPSGTLHIQSAGRDAVVLRARINNGRSAHDIVCHLSIEGLAGLRYRGTEEWITGSDPAEGIYALLFKTGAKDAFKITDMYHQIESDRVQDWNKLLDASKLACF